MRSLLLALSLPLVLSVASAQADPPRKPHPLAPSLPQLADAEEEKIDKIIDDFILFDTGKLTGEAGKKALAEFKKLGPEAIPALIRGLNRAAGIEASCPAVTIGKKLLAMLRFNDDPELLEFARENIGAGITRSPHMGVLKDLRFACMLRKRDLAAKGIVRGKPYQPPEDSPGDKGLRGQSVTQLTKAMGVERGEKLKEVLRELELRKGDEVIAGLVIGTGNYDADVASLARELLVKHLSRQPVATVKEKLTDESAAVRIAAAGAIAAKGHRLGAELIDLLSDKDAEVRQAARKALVALAKGTDYGPEPKARDADRAEAIRQWRSWWARQGSR